MRNISVLILILYIVTRGFYSNLNVRTFVGNVSTTVVGIIFMLNGLADEALYFKFPSIFSFRKEENVICTFV